MIDRIQRSIDYIEGKFGVSPGRFKAQSDAEIDAAIDGRPIELTATVLEPSIMSPRFLDLPAFRAVGLKGRFEASGPSGALDIYIPVVMAS